VGTDLYWSAERVRFCPTHRSWKVLSAACAIGPAVAMHANRHFCRRVTQPFAHYSTCFKSQLLAVRGLDLNGSKRGESLGRKIRERGSRQITSERQSYKIMLQRGKS